MIRLSSCCLGLRSTIVPLIMSGAELFNSKNSDTVSFGSHFNILSLRTPCYYYKQFKSFFFLFSNSYPFYHFSLCFISYIVHLFTFRSSPTSISLLTFFEKLGLRYPFCSHYYYPSFMVQTFPQILLNLLFMQRVNRFAIVHFVAQLLFSL